MSKLETLSKRPTGQKHPREVLLHGILESANKGETALFDVLPGVGKSYSILTVADAMPVTVLTNLKDNYDEFEDWGKDNGVPVMKLPVATDLCPVLKDSSSGDTVAQEARDAYKDGWSVSTIHQEFDLLCQREENTCPYHERLQEIDDTGRGLLVGHYTQGYNPNYLRDRVVVLDEDCFDDFVQEIKNPVEEAEKFIDTFNEFPFDSVRRPESGEEQKRKDALAHLENAGLDPNDHQKSAGEFHAKAPLVAYAIYAANRMENDWLVSDLPGDRTATFYDKPSGSLWLLDPPDLSKAETVIALDATPCISNWKRILGDDFRHYRLLDDDQRNQYLNEQGYEFVQLNNYVWPVSAAEVSNPKCEAYLREVAQKHDQRPDLITSKSLRDELQSQGLGHLWNDDLHYGDLRGKNDLKESELLVVLGSFSRRDSDIQHHAALHGECAEPATDDEDKRLSGYDLDYQSNVANEHLQNVRHGSVFQAAMRAGREDGVEATVYIATGMLPNWLQTKAVGQELPNGSFDACPKSNLRSPGERQVIEALRGVEGMEPSELYEQVNIGKDTAKDHRQALQEHGLVEKEGERRWARYSDNGLESLNIAGSVDLSLSGYPPFKDSIKGNHPIESRPEPLIPCQDQSDNPEDRYPDWMRDAQRRTRERRQLEQEKRRGDTA